MAARKAPVALRLSLDADADALLSSDPFALLTGMLLDQQFPMERAFAGPYVLAERLGDPGRLDPAEVVRRPPDELVALMTGPPAVHRFPGSMAARVQALAGVVVDTYGGDAARIWTTAGDGAELFARLRALPGFGEQKARIFVALLGKQVGVRPSGWEAAAGAYAEAGSRRSVADVTDETSLQEVRAFKQSVKRQAKERAAAPGAGGAAGTA
jgi:uncharacterized HhH-GPD family protein